jgi:hypothetical protein
MLNAQETRSILEDFLLDCLKFWLREGIDNSEAFDLAVRDVYGATNDPNEPYKVALLHEETKVQFIKDLKIIKRQVV